MFTAPYHVSRSLCIASSIIQFPRYLYRPHPSFQAHVTADVIFGRFIDVSSWRYPTMDVAFRIVMKSGGRHKCRKSEMLAISFIAALGQQTKLISGYTWSPNPTHPVTVFWRHRSPRSDFDPQPFSRDQLNVSHRVSTFVRCATLSGGTCV